MRSSAAATCRARPDASVSAEGCRPERCSRPWRRRGPAPRDPPIEANAPWWMTRPVAASIVIGQEDRSMGKVIPRSTQRKASAPEAVPPLQNGDRLTRDESERRYEAMPELKKAELIEGVVYLPSPVKHGQHGRPHGLVVNW